jgi:hypothetical protein
MNTQIEVVVVNQNGWWSAICKQLEISGFGESEQDALRAFQRALISNISARISAATSPTASVICEPTSAGGTVMRRIQLSENRNETAAA